MLPDALNDVEAAPSRPGARGRAGHEARVSWTEARRLARDAATRLPSLRVRQHEALGRVLAEDLRSHTAIPAFDTAAMDGYAVCGQGPFRVTGRVAAGDEGAGLLCAGEAMEVSTGATVPAGATAILRAEDAHWSGELLAGPAVVGGTHIRRAGEDAEAGRTLVAAGTRVRPATLGLAATCGWDDVLVAELPQVSIILTGDELISLGVSGRGSVRDALGPMLPGLIADFGGRVTELRQVRDEPRGALVEAVSNAASGPASVIVVTGSTSVGRTDQLRELLDRVGARWVVTSVDCRPGHPQLLAEIAPNTWVVGLPGNPFAAFVAAHTLLAPLIAGLTGEAASPLPTAVLRGAVLGSPSPGTRLVPAIREGDAVRAIGGDRPAFLGGAALADVLAAVPANWIPGQRVPVLGLR